MSELVTVLLGVLGGTAMAALINQVGESRRQKKQREAAKEDKKDDTGARLDAIDKRLAGIEATQAEQGTQLQGLRASEKAVLSDRIKWLGTKYMEAGEVEFEDRRNLHELHTAYKSLGGNGDYNILMADVDELPLKHH